ncbi:MAG: tRNA (N6-isopentenyl adenosine(37)-C2)-methylthiotransferase MiaB [Syntrophales bacterium]|nr:tRNA (N6-isopentenyl adenosine(37)-C2)-methylthiotransferase MiaB [Syntrophales bacterium]
MKYCYIHTFGCQMNVRDSQQVADLMEKEGYLVTDDLKAADLVIVNTCSVREKAEQKAHSLIGRVRRLKAAKPELVVGVMGCLAQQWGKRFFDRSPHLDFVCGTHSSDRIPDMVRKVRENGGNLEDTVLREHPGSFNLRVPSSPGSVAAYVTIRQGRDNYCAYCIVPFVRGREKSRLPGDIVDEVAGLAVRGVKEVTLLGQNVNSYGNTLDNKVDFPALLKLVGAVEGIERVRFTTSHPKDLSESLMDSFVEIDALCEHIHLPLQSGSDYILKRMKRVYTSEEYLEKIRGLRRRVPSISITTDIIVGFPGESDSDFEKTIDLMEKVRFDNAFSFKYSHRPGTAAESYDGEVEESVKSRRLAILQKLQAEHTLEKNRAMEGGEQEVLVEGISKGSRDDVSGRTRSNKIVNFSGESILAGRLVPVKIVRGYAHSLRGEMLQGGVKE